MIGPMNPAATPSRVPASPRQVGRTNTTKTNAMIQGLAFAPNFLARMALTCSAGAGTWLPQKAQVTLSASTGYWTGAPHYGQLKTSGMAPPKLRGGRLSASGTMQLVYF